MIKTYDGKERKKGEPLRKIVKIVKADVQLQAVNDAN